jgi:MAF protein
MQIVLGSSSAPRQQVLKQLGLPFTVIAPDINEAALPEESAAELVQRLSAEKALAVAQKTTQPSVIIACDQVLLCDEKIFGKPHTHEGAHAQLRFFSGKRAAFLSGISVLNQATGQQHTTYCPTHIAFKVLSDQQIHHYLHHTQPWHCAGSFKSESLGIALVQYMQSDDPYAILGLPLTIVCQYLEACGVDPLSTSAL